MICQFIFDKPRLGGYCAVSACSTVLPMRPPSKSCHRDMEVSLNHSKIGAKAKLTTIHPESLPTGVFHNAPQKMGKMAKMMMIVMNEPPRNIFRYNRRAAALSGDLSKKP